MRIVLTAGGTAGHIFPLLSVVEELEKKEEDFEIEFIGPKSVFEEEFEKRGIRVSRIASAKLRRYFSLLNILDFFKFFVALLQSLIKLYFYMPDLVFSKGGPSSLAVVLAAHFYFIPVFIHESDSIPGLSNRLASKYAKKIFISFEKSRNYFPKPKTLLVGNPIRKGLLSDKVSKKEAREKLGFKNGEPLIFVLGGSQGSQAINQFILDNLEQILEITQIVHQVGPLNYNFVKKESEFILKNSYYKEKYRIFPFLDENSLKLNFISSDLVISRAGSGAIFEIAAFGKPSILIPLETAASGHQMANALEYSKEGSAFVIEEQNLKPGLFLFDLNKILENDEAKAEAGKAAEKFAKPEAAKIIADEICRPGNAH